MYQRDDFSYLNGFCPVGEVQDQEVCDYLITPMVHNLVGSVIRVGRPQISDSLHGVFPGDLASNLNGHAFFGKRTDLARFPYSTTVHQTVNGAIVIRRDPRKVQVKCFLGDLLSGQAKLVHMASLRDRRYDGTPAANDCALLSFKYDHPYHHARITEAASLEFSVYSFLHQLRPAPGLVASAGSRGGPALITDQELDAFIEAPLKFLATPALFLPRFGLVWQGKRAPGQLCAPVPDVAKLLVPGVEQIARLYGYECLEGAVSHYNVALWLQSQGFRYSYLLDAEMMRQMAVGMAAIRAAGTTLSRAQEPWVAILQGLRPLDLIPAELYFAGLLASGSQRRPARLDEQTADADAGGVHAGTVDAFE